MSPDDRLPDVGARRIASREGLSTLSDTAAGPPAGARTSDSDPYAVAWVDLPGVPGRLGIAMAPGRRDSVTGAAWWRDLHADVRRIRHVHRAHTVVSLITDEELRDLHIADLAAALDVHGIEALRLQIRDGGVPAPADEGTMMALLAKVVRRVEDGRVVIVHCRAGQGRSGMVAAIVLALAGTPPDDAIAQVRRVQPRAVESVAQEAYVREAVASWARRRLGERGSR